METLDVLLFERFNESLEQAWRNTSERQASEMLYTVKMVDAIWKEGQKVKAGDPRSGSLTSEEGYELRYMALYGSEWEENDTIADQDDSIACFSRR